MKRELLRPAEPILEDAHRAYLRTQAYLDERRVSQARKPWLDFNPSAEYDMVEKAKWRSAQWWLRRLDRIGHGNDPGPVNLFALPARPSNRWAVALGKAGLSPVALGPLPHRNACVLPGAVPKDRSAPKPWRYYRIEGGRKQAVVDAKGAFQSVFVFEDFEELPPTKFYEGEGLGPGGLRGFVKDYLPGDPLIQDALLTALTSSPEQVDQGGGIAWAALDDASNHRYQEVLFDAVNVATPPPFRTQPSAGSRFRGRWLSFTSDGAFKAQFAERWPAGRDRVETHSVSRVRQMRERLDVRARYAGEISSFFSLGAGSLHADRSIQDLFLDFPRYESAVPSTGREIVGSDLDLEPFVVAARDHRWYAELVNAHLANPALAAETVPGRVLGGLKNDYAAFVSDHLRNRSDVESQVDAMGGHAARSLPRLATSLARIDGERDVRQEHFERAGANMGRAFREYAQRRDIGSIELERQTRKTPRGEFAVKAVLHGSRPLDFEALWEAISTYRIYEDAVDFKGDLDRMERRGLAFRHPVRNTYEWLGGFD